MNIRYKLVAGDLLYHTLADMIENIDGVEYLKHGGSVFEIIKCKFIQNGMLFDSEKCEVVAEIDLVDNLGKRIYQ